MISAEVISFSDIFDVADSLSQELRKVLGKSIPVQIFTDSNMFLRVISKVLRTSGKRTMLYITAAREFFAIE